MLKFRTLYEDEIEARIGTCKAPTGSNKGGVSILLYKDARVDMRLLDETVGPQKWQRKHELINGNLFCSVGISFDGEWIWKQDVGTESYTEKEKGQASDAFKRACFNWGIGRELYSAPFIWFTSDMANVKEVNGKAVCYDTFEVADIAYDDSGNISTLKVVDTKTKAEFNWTAPLNAKNEAKERAKALKRVNDLCDLLGITAEDYCRENGREFDATNIKRLKLMAEGLEKKLESKG